MREYIQKFRLKDFAVTRTVDGKGFMSYIQGYDFGHVSCSTTLAHSLLQLEHVFDDVSVDGLECELVTRIHKGNVLHQFVRVVFY